MSIRFRRTVTIFPGVHLNFGKSGVSLSFGRSGANVTLGPRGTFANLGLPGTGLSYRTRLDVPSRGSESNDLSNQHRPSNVEFCPPVTERTFEQVLRDLLKDREHDTVDWNERANWLDLPAPDENDDEAFDAFARKIAAARFAKRMVNGDRAAWAEVIREELVNEALPFDFSFEWAIEQPSERIYVGVELPDSALVADIGLPTMKQRALYEDVCCALILRFASEVFRVIPDVKDVFLVGYRPSTNSASGEQGRDIYLRLTTDRDSFGELQLDAVDPSSAFEHLGGAEKRHRGELQAIDFEPFP